MRLSSIIDNFSHFGNPLQIAFRTLFSRSGVMRITDRKTGVTVDAAVDSYRMFKETWYGRDYDVPACPLRKNDAVIDVGANQGFFSCYAASKGARVHAFEPFPESYRRLRSNVERNHFSSLVTTLQVGVSATAGRATMSCSEYLGGGANTIVAAHANAMKKERVADYHQSIAIETITMDEALSTIHGPIRLCKMDCEGSEFDLIRSLTNPSRIDSFAMEFHPGAYSLRDLVEIMTRWKTHQLSFSKTAYVLYAVRNEILAEHCDKIDFGLLPFQPVAQAFHSDMPVVR